jgi:hypothetical protein
MFIGLADGFCKNSITGGSYIVYDNVTELDPKSKNEFLKLNDLTPYITKCLYYHPKECRTNNNAEARTLHDLLICMRDNNILHPNNQILLLSDSKIVIQMVKGIYKCKSAALRSVIRNIHGLASWYRTIYNIPISKTVHIEHVPGVWQKLGPIKH